MQNFKIFKKSKGITNHSQKIKNGYIFCAYPGINQDGRDFIEDAISNGAKTVIAESEKFSIKKYEKKFPRIIFIKKRELQENLKKILDIYYKDLSKKIKIIGITGTNGKTSTAFWLNHLLKKLAYPSEMIGTISKQKGSVNTTPDIFSLYDLFNTCIKKKINDFVLEVSSHGISQGRIKGLKFEHGIFTNLSRDHLDYHKTMNNYFLSKQQFFLENVNKYSIVNIDDKYGKKLAINLKKINKKIITFGQSKNADILISNINYEINKKITTSFKLKIKNEIHIFSCNLIGKFNIYNLTSAVIVCLLKKISIEEIKKTIKRLPIPNGRMDILKCKIENKEKHIFIDYAHTPDGLLNALETLNEVYQEDIALVFGCGGDRDKGKRKMMAEIANIHSNYVCITTDNPRNEDPIDISKEISKHIKITKKIIIDRKKAIEDTIFNTKSRIILIAGKGHESYQIVKNQNIPFSDKKTVKQFLKKL
jgi:UDP-N-acetylmuramoyl-L-alanyl-D-glutamate--2,6-diaminopimelate ligase